MKIKHLVSFAAAACLAASVSAETLPLTFAIQGNAGTGSPNGHVSAPPAPVEGSGYYYVSTYKGTNGVGALPSVGGTGNPTNGSTLTTGLFNANSGDVLNFYFNYVTSDGAGYADYAWARLLDSDANQVALLFTARTTPGGSTVPGFGMPDPGATLTPADVSINAGAPQWSQLGGSSGTCYDTGCGSTGWILSEFKIGLEGQYMLQLGVTNWNDTLYDSGLAFAGLKIGDTEIAPPVSAVPLPGAGWLMMGGLGSLAAMRRRRKAKAEGGSQ